MRLLDTKTLKFKEFFDSDIPHYAILSHRWGQDEATFQDFEMSRERKRLGFSKIRGFCKQARLRGQYEWAWVDTCCIDKKSSAELSEAINSMYRWYKRSKDCYVHLSDVRWINSEASEEAFRRSEWFTRGWTLQELLAPTDVTFFDQAWRYIGTKKSHISVISKITGIDEPYLHYESLFNLPPKICRAVPQCHAYGSVDLASIATRMSWAPKRKTSRIEDMAYCLLGLFQVNMPLLYGEGQRAFLRLQGEILKQSMDESIFAWCPNPNSLGASMLASAPSYFKRSGHVHVQLPTSYNDHRPSCTLTDRSLELPITWRSWDEKRQLLRVVLNCGICSNGVFKDVVIALAPPESRPFWPMFNYWSLLWQRSQEFANLETVSINDEIEKWYCPMSMKQEIGSKWATAAKEKDNTKAISTKSGKSTIRSEHSRKIQYDLVSIAVEVRVWD